ncbi:MAG: replication initiation factor domain-containing protein [Staphylococcus equorum]|nr:replication initiation factor domain-containing protein [Staphylococcus equorum]
MLISNIDTLICSFDIADYEERNIELFSLLEEKKQDAATATREFENNEVNVKLGFIEFKILGNGRQGYAYILHNDLLEINLARFRSKMESFYPLRIRWKSEYLWSCGFKNSWQLVEEWIKETLGEIIDCKISRVDLCCHIDDLKLELYNMANFKGSYRNQNIYLTDRKVSSMNFGSRNSPVYLRIYDKVLEIKVTRNKTWFNEIWKHFNIDLNNVWNVEFELHRDFLREKQINNFTELYESLQTLWRYLTTKWIVMIKNDNVRTDRCETEEVWKKIQGAFDKYEDKPLIERAKQLDCDAKALVPQIVGCIASYGARLGVEDIDYVYQMLHSQSKEYLERKNISYDKKIEEKMKSLNHNIRLVVNQ